VYQATLLPAERGNTTEGQTDGSER
jgi:hypothetical protein